MPTRVERNERLRRYWDKHAGSYDREMGFFDRHVFGDTRDWVCSQAVGEVLEVAIGTGLNLPHYPPQVRLTGVEWSQRLLDLVTIPLGGEHFRRRPIIHLQALGYAIEGHQRFKLGIVERLAARKPHASAPW